MSVPPIDVEPEVFDAASKVMGQNVTGQLTTALTNLEDALAGTGGMAGTDPGGTKWASSYDQAVSATVGAMTDLTDACYMLAAMLEQTGFNHGMAESASDPRRSVQTPADTTRYVAPMTLNCNPQPPSAQGGSGSPPTGWGLIESAVGYVWPNGHQDKLRAAGNAWSTAAKALDWASYAIDEGVQGISSQQSPEVQDAVAVCGGMKQHIQDVATSCQSLASGCDEFAGYIDKAHHDVEQELTSLVEWTVAIEAGGAILGFLTAGIAEAPAQGLEAGRIYATAVRVGNIISHLIELAGTVAETISSVVTRVAEVCQRLKVILGARLSAATTRLVARLPALANDSGAVAFGRLRVWEQGWSTRGLQIEARLGGNLPRSFPTIDKFENGVVTSIKSVDLTGATYQNTASLTSRLRGYVDKVANFKNASFDGTTIRARDVTQRALQVAIQPGVASPAQQAVLDQLAQYAKSKGVKLIVSEVP